MNTLFSVKINDEVFPIVEKINNELNIINTITLFLPKDTVLIKDNEEETIITIEDLQQALSKQFFQQASPKKEIHILREDVETNDYI